MDCEHAEPLIYPDMIGALDANLSSNLGRHLDACDLCCEKLRGYGDKVADMARAVPQLQAPDRIRRSLLAKIDYDRACRDALTFRQVRRLAAGFAVIIVAASVSRKRAASLLLGISLLLGGFWINQMSPVVDSQPSSPATVAGRDSRLLERQETATAVAELVKAEAYSPYKGLGLTPPRNATLSMLHGTTKATGARGVLIASDGEAVLLALNLPPLPSDKVYQIWLVKAGDIIQAGFLSVDAAGYGHTVIIPYISVAEYDGIGITVEPASGSADPTGDSVLQGDL